MVMENLSKLGDNKEGEIILSNLNSSIIRIIEFCNHDDIFVVLFRLLTKYKDCHDQPRIHNLIIKCLLKLSKNMSRLVEKINLNSLMLAIHQYTITISQQNQTQNDDLGKRICKTLINECVKLKKHDIWQYYQVIEKHDQVDNHI